MSDNFLATYPGGSSGGASSDVVVTNFPAIQAVTGPLTDDELRASAIAVSGNFFQALQPISGIVSVDNFPVTQPISGIISVSNFPATQAVTGTFFQATQPVSGAFFQATQPVSGLFFQATQPVSIAASVAVTGPLTDTQLRNTAVPVSGNFFQATQPISGSVSISNFPVTQPVSLTSTTITGSVAVTGPLTDTQIRATPLPVSGTVAVSNFPATQPVSIASAINTNIASAASAAISSVASSASNINLLASNANRKMAAIYNDSTATLYVKLGATASTSSYTVQLISGAYYELPVPAYSGQIDGIWATANGNARITEY